MAPAIPSSRISSGYDRQTWNPDSPDELVQTARMAQFSASAKLGRMVERHIVTAFLALGKQILLLRCSDRVRTYRGLWAGVSGSVEAGSTPIEQAIQEIEEETGLSDVDAIPVLAGQPFDFEDEAFSRQWIVHPFRFRVNDEAKIRLDWEHSEAVWTEPAQIERLPTVPRLFDAWLRVAFLHQWIEQSLDDIRQDRSSGAAELARKALALLAAAAEHAESSSSRELADLLGRAAGALSLGRPTMAPIGYWAGRFQAGLAGIEANRPSLPALRSVVATSVCDLEIEGDQLSHRLADDVANTLGDADVVVTASYSSSLVKGLSRAAGQGKHVRVLALASGHERPSFGQRTADAARSAGLDATLVPDDELPSAVQQADLALIGADSVLPDGAVVNGTPSGQLAETAHSAGLPVIVAAGPTKRVEEDSPALGWLRPGRLEAGFDLVPAGMIDVIL